MSTETTPNPIDTLMEQASAELMRGSYLLCANMCINALRAARADHDFERMSRIILPLQEANRYLRQESLENTPVRVISSGTDLGDELAPGCFLFTPPLVGADARQFRAAANDAGVGIHILTREPRTSKDQWPIVGVGECVVRVRLSPPTNAIPADGLLGDTLEGPIDPAWFALAGEALGDQAIVDAYAAGDADDPPAWVVDDFLDRFYACPDHEKFLQAMADACRNAINAPITTKIRRRGVINDPFSF